MAARETVYPKMTLSQKKGAIWTLLALSENDSPPYGELTRVARTFSVHRITIKRLWERALVSRLTGLCNSPEMVSLRLGNQNAPKYPGPMLLEAIKGKTNRLNENSPFLSREFLG
jgi:hypothetical protein